MLGIMRSTLAGVFCFLVCVVPAWPQQKQPSPPAATTTVSGRVYCADTNAPARMATVVLLPAAAIDSITPGEPKNISSRGEAAITLLDGSFILQHVEPGTYYVIASQPGYVSPLAPLYIRPPGKSASEGQSARKTAVTAPRITVQANLPAVVNVTIERGAAVNGTIQYDDGSPASGIQVTLLARWKDDWNTIPSDNPVAKSDYFGQTDDEGHYRLSGLPPGEYLVQAELALREITYHSDEHGSGVSSGSGSSLDIYSGGSTRPKDAAPFSLTPGEERRGVDIEIPIARLHTVRGNIVAAHDGHVLNGGSLQLLYPDDKNIAANASLTKDSDTFSFSFVPEGDYILTVWGASDTEYREIPDGPNSWPPARTEPHVLRGYGHAEQRIHVTGDLSGITIAAPDLPAPTSQATQ
jgi:hypothetical protein